MQTLLECKIAFYFADKRQREVDDDYRKEREAEEALEQEDGIRASELEAEFAELNGWEAESDASRLLQGLGIGTDMHYDMMGDTDPRLKVKVLLAQALFGNPDIIMLDEPTNNLDIEAINWLEDFLLDFPGMVIAVSHDRHFLNTVCTHTVDIDYGKIKMYVGNYDFWYESSQMVQAMIRNKNKRNQEKIEELQLFIQRFSANKSKAKQATARRKLLDKLTVEEMPCSTRRYPFVGFQPERELGKDILTVKDVSVTVDGVKLLDKVYFSVGKNDKIAFVGENELVDENGVRSANKNGGNPAEIVEKRGMVQVSDEGQLEEWAKAAIAANPKAVADYQKGNKEKNCNDA